MSFDLYGHGIRKLPSSGTEFYSDGPDRKRGPAKCRGVSGTCSSGAPNPHDHACCCDPCRHHYVDLCVGGDDEGNCCRCIPRAICARFIPDATGDRCFERYWNSEPSTVGTRSVYSYQIPDNGELNLSVGTNPIFSGGTCTWQLSLEDMYIDEEQAINHSSSIHCQAPPDFSLSGINVPFHPVTGPPEDCYGTITFEEASLAKIPFVKKWINIEEFVDVSGECNYCDEICKILCVKKGNLNSESYTRTEYAFNSSGNLWEANDFSGKTISLIPSGDACYLRFDNFADPFAGDLIQVASGECSLGMDLYALDEVTDDWLRVSCNPCSCWDYVCGQCRCVCKELCVIGVTDGVLVGPKSLAWDKDLLAWSGEDLVIGLDKDDYDNCVATITGYPDPVSIENSCGDELSFNVSNSVEDQLTSGLINFLYISCKRCIGEECGGGTCLTYCQDVPEVLYAEICPSAWTPMLGCDDENLCFACITIPLVQIFVSTISNPAGEYRWIGYGIISCHNCNPPTEPKNFLVSIDIGCDGILRFGGVCSEEFVFTLPCNDEDVWDLEFETSSTCGQDGPEGCCDEGKFIIRITE